MESSRLFIKRYRDSGVLQLAGILLASLFIYALAFLAPANLLRLHDQPRLDLYLLFRGGVPAHVRLVLAFIGVWTFYLLGYRVASRTRGRGAWSVLLLGMLAFSTVLLFVAPFDAADIYDNIMHSRIWTVYGANPFQQVIAEYPDDPFYEYAAWKRAISAYGPLWELLAGVTARLAGDGMVANVLAFKSLSGLFYFASVGLVVLYLRRYSPEQALGGAILLAWNPVMLYETWGNGHNDVVMAFWFLAAAWWVSRQHFTLAALSLLVGGLIKFIPILLIPAVLTLGLRSLETFRSRFSFLAKTGLFSALIAAAAYAPFWNGFASFSIERRMSMFTVSIPSVLHRLLSPALGADGSARTVILAALGTLAVFVVYQSIRVREKEPGRSFPQITFNILVFYLLVTCLWFQQWYSLWLLCLVPLLTGSSRRLVLLFSFWVVSKQLVFGPLIVPTMVRHPETSLRLEPLLTVSILGVPWVYALWILLKGCLKKGPNAAN